MKCRACDCILSDTEAVRKDSNDEFLDICYDCDSGREYIEYLPIYVEREEHEED